MLYLVVQYEPLKSCVIIVAALASAVAGHAQPVLVVVDTPAEGHVGGVLYFTCEVRWEGESDAYTVFPAVVTEVAWAEGSVLDMVATSENGLHRVKQRIALAPKKAGEFDTPEIVVPYIAGNAESNIGPEASAIALVAGPFSVVISAEAQRARWPMLAGPAAVALVGLLGYGFYARRAAVAPEAAGMTPLEQVQHALHEAKRRRLDGDYYAYYQALSRAAALMGEGAQSPGPLNERLARRTQEVGYGGVRPTEDQIDGDQRDTERALQRWKEEMNV